MGLFGDKAMKLLDRKLESGWMSLEMGAKLGRIELTVNNVGNELLAACSGLKKEGRTSEALEKLQHAHRPGDDKFVVLWNELLDKIGAEM